MTPKIHPSAIIEDGAVLGADVEIGPYCVIGSQVRLGDGVRLASHVVVTGNTQIGPRTFVHSHAVLGGSSQFRNPPGGDAESGLRIGADNVIREHVTMNMGTAKGGNLTRVGDRGYFMAYSHVAHDCHVGNDVTFANSVAMAGHVVVEDGVTVGGLAAVLQYVRLGRGCFIGGVTGIAADVIPYGLVQGSRGVMEGLNVLGLKRRGLTRTDLHKMRAAYDMLFFGAGSFQERVEKVAVSWPDFVYVQEIIAFIRTASKRPICMPEAAPPATDNS